MEAEVISSIKELELLIDSKNPLVIVQNLRILTTNVNVLLNILSNGSKHEFSHQRLLKILRYFCADSSKTIRSYTLRLLSHLVSNTQIAIGLNNGIDYFISCAIESEGHVTERKEAFKICNNLVDYNCSYFPRCLILSLFSIAKQVGEPYCLVALEMMTAIASKNPRLCAETGSIQVLFNSLHSPSFKDLHKPITQVLLSLLDPPLQRKAILPHIDISMLLSPLTEPYPKNRPEILEIMNERWKQCTETCVYLLKSWEGLISLASHPYGLNSYLNALALPNMPIRQHIVYSLFEILRIPIPKPQFEPLKPPPPMKRVRTPVSNLDMIDSFVASVLFVLVHLGLIPALIKLGVEIADSKEAEECCIGCAPLGTAVTILLSEVLNLSNRLLPTRICADLETLPLLLKQSVDFNPDLSADPIFREKSHAMIENLHNLANEKIKLENYSVKDRSRIRNAKRQMYIDMDEQMLTNKLKETQIFLKNYHAWNWDLILDLLSVPLAENAAFASVAIKMNFIKQLVTFYSPTARGHFADELISSEKAQVFRDTFEILVEFILNHAKDDLIDMISEISVLLKKEIDSDSDSGRSDALKQTTRKVTKKNLRDRESMKIEESDASKMDSQKKKEVITETFFSKKRVQKCLVREYIITCIGYLSRFTQAVDILNQYDIFNYLNDLCSKRNDLCLMVLPLLEYNIKETHIIFETICSRQAHKAVMLNFVRQLLREKSNISHSWVITMLMEKLNNEEHLEAECVTLVEELIEEAIEIPECLAALLLLDKTPLKKHKGGKNILYKLLADPKGFELLSIDFLNFEFDEWMRTGNDDYAKNLNDKMSLATGNWTSSKVPLPPHLIGELAKTQIGCNFLIKKNIISIFTKVLHQAPEESLQQRSAMWALGHIMCSPYVSKLIPNIREIVKYIIMKAETSLTLSFRGVAFYVVGLITLQKEVRQIIEECGWEAAGNDRLIAFPKDFKKSNLFCLTTQQTSESENEQKEKDPFYYIIDYKKNNIFNLDNTQLEILQLVEKLVNLEKQHECTLRLKKMLSRDPTAFTNANTLLIVFKLLEYFKFTIKERQFIRSLFQKVERNELLMQLDKIRTINV